MHCLVECFTKTVSFLPSSYIIYESTFTPTPDINGIYKLSSRKGIQVEGHFVVTKTTGKFTFLHFLLFSIVQ